VRYFTVHYLGLPNATVRHSVLIVMFVNSNSENGMRKELKSEPKLDSTGKANESYITQMLRQLVVLASERDPELTYFIEMAAAHSSDLDMAEGLARRRAEEKFSRLG
jgi:hypothetical protein